MYIPKKCDPRAEPILTHGLNLKVLCKGPLDEADCQIMIEIGMNV